MQKTVNKVKAEKNQHSENSIGMISLCSLKKNGYDFIKIRSIFSSVYGI